MNLYDFSCNPLAAWLTVNQACNMRCGWCYCSASNYDPSQEMTLELAKELVDISSSAGVGHVNIIGGEPTLWPYLFELFSYIKSKNMTVGLITNSTKFGDDIFWNAYQKNPANRISISVKSASKDSFKDVTSSSEFSKTFKGIERAISFHQTGITTVYNSLVGIDGLIEIAEKCRNLGANSIIVNMCSPVIDENLEASRGYSIDPLSIASDTSYILSIIDEMYEGNAEIDIQMPLCLFPSDFIEKNLSSKKIMTLCQIFSRSGLNFNVDGNVTICNEFAVDEIAVKGVDFIDGKSLLKHLNSPKIKDIYKDILRYPSKECQKCRWKNDCRGGCLMNWLILDPSICSAI